MITVVWSPGRPRAQQAKTSILIERAEPVHVSIPLEDGDCAVRCGIVDEARLDALVVKLKDLDFSSSRGARRAGCSVDGEDWRRFVAGLCGEIALLHASLEASSAPVEVACRERGLFNQQLYAFLTHFECSAIERIRAADELAGNARGRIADWLLGELHAHRMLAAARAIAEPQSREECKRGELVAQVQQDLIALARLTSAAEPGPAKAGEAAALLESLIPQLTALIESNPSISRPALCTASSFTAAQLAAFRRAVKR